MKKQYSTPQLTNHGSVESITQLFGNSSATDFLFFPGNANSPNAGSSVAAGEGSIDGQVIPKKS